MHASIHNNRLKWNCSEIYLSIVLTFCRLTLHRYIIQGHLPKSFNREDKNNVKKSLTLDFFNQHTSVSLVSLVHQLGRFYISGCYNRSLDKTQIIITCNIISTSDEVIDKPYNFYQNIVYLSVLFFVVQRHSVYAYNIC